MFARTRTQSRKLKTRSAATTEQPSTTSSSEPTANEHIRKDHGLLDYWNSIDWIKEQQKEENLRNRSINQKLFCVRDRKIYRRKDSDGERLAIPEPMVKEVVQKVHNSGLCAHGGVEKTSYHLRSVWFPGFHRRIKELIGTCATCLAAKGM